MQQHKWKISYKHSVPNTTRRATITTLNGNKHHSMVIIRTLTVTSVIATLQGWYSQVVIHYKGQKQVLP